MPKALRLVSAPSSGGQNVAAQQGQAQTPTSYALSALVACGIELRDFGEAGQRWLVQLKPDPLGGMGIVNPLPQYDIVTDALSPVLADLPGVLIGIDGPDGVGKTTLGRYLAWHFNSSLVETDLFLKSDSGRLEHHAEPIHMAVRHRLDKPRPVFVDGVALLRLLNGIDLEPSFLIYVTHSGHAGSHGLAEELKQYREQYRPVERADLRIELAY